MKRTIKQYSATLTKQEKKALFEQVIIPYNKQKDAFLVKYAHLDYLQYVNSKTNQQTLRDNLLASGFTSSFGLQKRVWKLALTDALDTINRYWEAIISLLKSEYLYRHEGLTDDEKHYANWLLFKPKKQARDFNRLIAIYRDIDLTDEHIILDDKGRKKVRSYLHRTLRKITGKRSRVQIYRSVDCDPQTYKIKTDKQTNQQYVEITTLTPRKPIKIFLCGKLNQKGNGKIVYDEVKNRIEVHQIRDAKKHKLGNNVVAGDYGTTEVVTDDQGAQYGQDFGRLLTRYNAYLLEKGRKRNKLTAIANNATNKKKANRIIKNNLKSFSRDKRHQRERAALENEINQAYRKLFISSGVGSVGFEDLSDMRGKTKYKGLSRRVSLWIRTHLKERLEFLSHLFDINVTYINPAYTSQECNHCHYVNKQNRNGDYFKCKVCGLTGHADHLAAKNIKNRMNDKAITIYTKHKDVKELLNARHQEWQSKQNANKVIQTV